MVKQTAIETGVLQDTRRTFQADILRRIREHDTHGIGDGFYCPDAFVCPWSGEATFGLDHIRSFWRALLEAGLETVGFEQQWIEQGGNLAYEIGHYTMQYRPVLARGTSGEAIKLEGSYLAVLREQDDGAWRITAEMYTCAGNELALAHLRMPARASGIPRGGFAP